MRNPRLALVVMGLVAVVVLLAAPAAFAHHNGNNPMNGNINEERVHSGMPTDMGQRSMNGQNEEFLVRNRNQTEQGSGSMNENRSQSGRPGDGAAGIYRSMFGWLHRLFD